MVKTTGIVAIAAVLSLAAPALGLAAEAGSIGVAAAVRNAAQGVRGTQTDTLRPGSSVFQNETVRTGATDTAQLLFLDQTSLSVGPGSEVTLDQFVYDPQRNTGQAVINATRGAFRFVTGSQDPRNYTLKTPVASIGVRGTIVDFLIDNGQLIVILEEGGLGLTLNGGQTMELNELGSAYMVAPNGNVSGPFTYDGSLKGGTFPLYATHYTQDPNQPTAPDSAADLINELLTHGHGPEEQGGPTPPETPPEVPPPPPSGGGCTDCNFHLPHFGR
jgi:hypothetical protein